MLKSLTNKLKDLPKSPGVYFFKDVKGEIIYIGKAAVLKNRVQQYFQSSRNRDQKTEVLVGEIADVEWQEVDSELDALFLEAELVRRYLPRYNILLRDDKSMVFIRIDYDSDYPTVSTTCRPLDDKARYYGPYMSTQSVKQALKLLRRVFPFATRKILGQKRASLHYHLGLDPGLEEGKTTISEYRTNLRRLMAVITGKRSNIEKELSRDLKKYAKALKFEEAAKYRNQIYALKKLSQQVVFGDTEFLDISKDHALNELAEILGLLVIPRHVEGYDVSHMSGTDVVASMVVFTNGVSDKAQYRKFKTKQNKNDDFYNIHETIARRLSFQGPTLETGKRLHNKQNASDGWKRNLPDLVLIDGGKGQLDAAIRARDEAGVKGSTFRSIPFIGLAKREEQVVVRKADSKVQNSKFKIQTLGSGVKVNLGMLHKLGGYAKESGDFILVNLPHNTSLVKLLQRIRDESHRFAVSYHSTLKTKRQIASSLDDIPGVGPATRKKLIKAFGSTKGVLQAAEPELAKVIGPNLTAKILSGK